MTFIARPLPRLSLPKTSTGGADAAEHLSPAAASVSCPNPESDGSHGLYLLAAPPMVTDRTRKRTGRAGADGSAESADTVEFRDARDATGTTAASRLADTDATAAFRLADTDATTASRLADTDATAASRLADPSEAARAVRAGNMSVRSVPEWMDRQAGMATAEYAIATLAAVAFAGLLAVVLGSDEVRGMLVSLIRSALTLG